MEKADGIMTGDVDEELVKHLKRWNDDRPTKAQPATLPGIIATLQAMAPLLLSRLLRNCGFAHCITKRLIRPCVPLLAGSAMHYYQALFRCASLGDILGAALKTEE